MLVADSIHSGPGGQWGVTHDNYGRLFLTSAGSENPLVRVQMNPAYGSLDMPEQADNEFQQVWPIISTPDVQGGLSRLRADSTLNHFTGACGQSIYRGNTLPQDMVGDYIICEPVARVIRRAKVINLKGKIIGKEGRNIKSFERETGVEIIVDDTPGSITLSSFDPVRRAVANSCAADACDGIRGRRFP